MTEGQKSIDLLPSGSRETTGVRPKAKNHLSVQARIIFEAFERIWDEDEEFQIGLKTIENHLKGTP